MSTTTTTTTTPPQCKLPPHYFLFPDTTSAIILDAVTWRDAEKEAERKMRATYAPKLDDQKALRTVTVRYAINTWYDPDADTDTPPLQNLKSKEYYLTIQPTEPACPTTTTTTTTPKKHKWHPRGNSGSGVFQRFYSSCDTCGLQRAWQAQHKHTLTNKTIDKPYIVYHIIT